MYIDSDFTDHRANLLSCLVEQKLSYYELINLHFQTHLKFTQLVRSTLSHTSKLNLLCHCTPNLEGLFPSLIENCEKGMILVHTSNEAVEQWHVSLAVVFVRIK